MSLDQQPIKTAKIPSQLSGVSVPNTPKLSGLQECLHKARKYKLACVAYEQGEICWCFTTGNI